MSLDDEINEAFNEIHLQLKEVVDPAYWQKEFVLDEFSAQRCASAANIAVIRALGVVDDFDYFSDLKAFLKFRDEKLISEAANRLNDSLCYPSRPKWLCAVGYNQRRNRITISVTEENEHTQFLAKGFECYQVQIDVVEGGFIAGPDYQGGTPSVVVEFTGKEWTWLVTLPDDSTINGTWSKMLTEESVRVMAAHLFPGTTLEIRVPANLEGTDAIPVDPK